MGYLIVGQARTIRSSVINENKFKISIMALRSILMIPCEMLFRIHLNNIRVISLLVSCRGGVDYNWYVL